MPQIFVESLGAYNAGQGVGRWVDCSLGESTIADEIEDIISLGVGDEWFVADFEGWGDYHVSEYPNIDVIAEIAYYIDEYGEDLFGVYARLADENGWKIDDFEDHYIGEAESEGAFAQNYFEDLYGDDLGPLVSYIQNWDIVFTGELSDAIISEQVNYARWLFFSY